MKIGYLEDYYTKRPNKRAELIRYFRAGIKQYDDYMNLAKKHVVKMVTKNASELKKQPTDLKLMAKRAI